MGDMSKIEIIKGNGEKEIFDESKLFNSLEKAGASKDAQEEVVTTVTKDLKDGMTTAEIYKQAFDILKTTERAPASRYSLRQSIMQLGPSGYPFEKFLAELYKAEGYFAKVGQMVPGACVEHELDVVASKDNEKIFVEAKFHNSRGYKSDIKDALYVKSRFDDILPQLGSDEVSYQGILITNTKFSSSALKYGECAGLSMMGWNYPNGKSLVNWIEKSNLHPITCLTTLSTAQKQNLLNKGLILNRDLYNNTIFLKDVGFSETDIKEVIEEIEKVSPQST